ncbi:UNVERIFIED_ORG: PAS domain S-box-containing protein/diguanylate cyclase (GGDEF)-like protein [Martelella mediterranea]
MFRRKGFAFRFLVFFAPPAAIVVAALLLAINTSIASKIEILFVQNKETVSRGEVIIDNNIEAPIRDLSYLANNGLLNRLLENDNEITRSELELDWITFAREEGRYDQIRWIDETGMEQVRIDHVRGETVTLDRQLLQDKADRYYFRKSEQLTRGKIYVSPLDLNVELGIVEAPEKPVIRFATPVFDATGVRRGVTVLNYLARPLLTELQALGERNLWLVNKDGYWLQGPSLAVEWGFMYGLPAMSLAAQYPDMWATIQREPEGQIETADGIWTFKTVDPFGPSSASADAGGAGELARLELNEGQQWYLVHFLPRADYADIARASWRRGGMATALVLGLLAIVSWRLARSHIREEQTAAALAQRNESLSEKTEALQQEVELRTAAEKELQSSIELYRAILRNSVESFILLDREGRIKEANEAFCSLIGRRAQQIVGRNISELGFEEVNSDLRSLLSKISHRGQNKVEAGLKITGGQELFVEMNLVYLYQTDNVFAFMRNITDEKIHLGELQRSAYYDVLTNIPNRMLLNERLTSAIGTAAGTGAMIAVLFIDLDGFKRINDQFGHAAGDHVLITIAERFAECVRPQDTVARIGGDEFAALLVNITSVEDCASAAERFLNAASKPVDTPQGSHGVSASIGIALLRQDEYADGETLLRRADHAMYQAKIQGKNRYHIAGGSNGHVSAGDAYDAGAIRHALEQEQFELFYQPKVNARTGTVEGFEALLRWNHPTNGLLLPGVFLPQIEQHPVSLDLAKWVIRTAIGQLDEWTRNGRTLSISINVSLQVLLDERFVSNLEAALVDNPHVSAGQVELELLETSDFVENPDVVETISRATKLGVGFAVDDFGTGYSSLAQLKRLSISTLKIDRSLIAELTDDPDILSILIAIMSLAEAMQCKVVAEGVETLEQGIVLRQLGCETVQGYFVARPMPADLVPDWVKNWSPPEAWRAQGAISRDMVQLLVACTYHRAWMRRLKAAISDRSLEPPELDHTLCRFGVWLHSDAGQELCKACPEARQLEQIHHQMHVVARRMLSEENSVPSVEYADYMSSLEAAGARMRSVIASILGAAVCGVERKNGPGAD